MKTEFHFPRCSPARERRDPFARARLDQSRPTPGGLHTNRAFSLIELIGVLAIIAIMATIIAPNAVRMMDSAAVRAERENVRNLADQVKLYLINTGSLPSDHATKVQSISTPPVTIPKWTRDLSSYADLNELELTTNRRRSARVFLHEPGVTPVKRAILLSAMKSGLVLPVALNSTQFNTIWNAADDSSIPAAMGWGWSASDARDYFVLQRVNLSSVYSKELKSYTVTLQNRSDTGSITTTTTTTNGGGGNNGNGNGNNGNGNGNGNGNNGGGGTTTTTTTTSTPALPASYRHVPANGSSAVSGSLVASGPVMSLTCSPGDKIEMYTTATASGAPSYVYVVNDHGASFEFNPQGDWVIR